MAGSIIEPFVWDAAAELLRDPQQIVAAWEAEAAQSDTTPDELKRLQTRQRKLERQWIRLLDAFQDGLLDKTELGQRKQRLEQERETITERISNGRKISSWSKHKLLMNFPLFVHRHRRRWKTQHPK